MKNENSKNEELPELEVAVSSPKKERPETWMVVINFTYGVIRLSESTVKLIHELLL